MLSLKQQEKLLKEWRPIVEEFRSSNMSQRDFCRRKEIGRSRFHYWKRKIEKQKERKSIFFPVKIKETRACVDRFIEINFPDGLKIQLPEHKKELLLKGLLGGSHV